MRTRFATVALGVWIALGPAGTAIPLAMTQAGAAAIEADRQADQAKRPKAAEQGDDKKSRHGDILADTPDTETQLAQLEHALARLPIAAGLASLLAIRPRRRGTPRRQASVVQTQIILAIVGAVVMLVVGSSLARAFGIVGAAGLVRYRAKIEDPKDAGVMLSTLAIGLASGVGLWMLAVFTTAFVIAVLWVIESFEPRARSLFALTVKAEAIEALKPQIEAVLRRHQVQFELRTASTDALCYEARLPLEQKTDAVSRDVLDLDRKRLSGVEWEEKKEKKG